MSNQCVQCGICCRHVAIEMDEPEDQEDYNNVLWYLYHENVNIFIDDEDDWYIEFVTPCTSLEDNMCSVYDKRPAICRDYSPENCVHNGEGEAYKFKFTTPDEFMSYCKLRGIRIKIPK